MIRPVVKDILFLGQKSEPATKDDVAVIDDLLYRLFSMKLTILKV